MTYALRAGCAEGRDNRMSGRSGKRIRLVIAASLLLAGACSRDLDLPAAKPTTGTVIGRAVAEVPGTDQVEAVKGAVISVPGTNLHAVSDGQGSFSVGPLPAGTYKVLVELRGTQDTARQRLLEGVSVTRGGTSTLGDISLRRNAVVTGRALISGATHGNQGITVFVPGTDFVSATADTGAWRLSNLPEGPTSVGAFRPGFTAAFTATINAQGGLLTTAVDLVIDPSPDAPQPAAIAGTVGVVGGVLTDVKVSAYQGGSATAKATASPDSTGKFVLQNLPSDLYRLEATLSGFVPVVVPNLLVTSGASLHLPDPLLLIAPGQDNVTPPPFDGGSGPADAGALDAGSDAGTDAGVVDGGVGAECNSDNDCASGRLCSSGRCVGCSSNTDCRAGYLCQVGDCIRACTQNADCPTGLVCNSGSCGPCVGAADCKDPSLVCLAGGSCGHCKSGNDCPSGKACLATGCGACSADNDCGTGRICEQGACLSGTCHDRNGCAANQACLGHQCLACTGDNDCAAGRLCLSGACNVANCRDDSSCAPTDACLGNLCGACSNKSQCRTGQVCDKGTCASGDCASSGDCSGGQICVGHTCSACTQTSDCGLGSGKVCAAGACVIGDCVSPGTCASNGVCKGNHCQSCGSTADCTTSYKVSGLVCDNGQCLSGDCLVSDDCAVSNPGKVCVTDHCSLCTSTSQCKAGQVCASTGLCTAGDCATTAGCVGTKQGMICVGTTCSPCGGDGDCVGKQLCQGVGAAARCTAGECRTAATCSDLRQGCVGNFCGGCDLNGDCRGGQVCDNHVCVTGICTGTGLNQPGCGTGQRCVGNQCVGCSTNSDCGFPGANSVCVSNLCVPGNCTSPANCAAGQLCSTAHLCGSCGQKSDCTTSYQASNLVCDTGSCYFGECAGRDDCGAPSSAGKICDLPSHTCVGCGNKSQCKTGEICTTGGLCAVGTCATNAECPVSAGVTQACLNNNCLPCGTDAQCNPGVVQASWTKVCAANSTCVAGNCHFDSECNSSKDLCIANTCTHCATNNATFNGQINGGCGTGRICDPNGDCQVGTCAQNSDCKTAGNWDGRLCTGFACVGCVLGTSASCGAGFLCDGPTSRCVLGTCQSNADCTAPTSCINHSCSGQCRQASDCYSRGATCNTATHACVACASSAECGAPASGLVCNGSGQCIAGTCASDVACTTPGQSCVNFQCVQVAPAPPATTPPSITSGTLYPNNGASAVVAGKKNLYVTMGTQVAGIYSTITQAFDPNSTQSPGTMKQLWSVVENSNSNPGNGASTSIVQQNLVIPSPGVPGDEVLAVSDGNNRWVLRAGKDGTKLGNFDALFSNGSTQSIGQYAIAAGIANGAPALFGYVPPGAGLNAILRTRPDGVGTQLQSAAPPCTPIAGPVTGSVLVYFVCGSAILGVDPDTLSVRLNDPFPGGITIAGVPQIAISRLGVGDLITFFSYNTKLYAGVMLDTDAQQSGHHITWLAPVSINNDSNPYSPVFVDSSGFVWTLGAGVLTMLDPASNMKIVNQATVNSFFPSANADTFSALGNDGTFIGYDLSGATPSVRGVAFNSSSTVATQWQISLPAPGLLPKLWPNFVPASVVSGGALALWSQPSGVPPQLGLYPSPKGNLASPSPAWTTRFGNASNQNAIWGTACSDDSLPPGAGGCTSPASCVLGRCIGACSSSNNTCGPGLGCSNGVCGGCSVDSSCHSGDVCFQSTCIACTPVPPLNQCCHTNADCGGGAACQRGACVPVPTFSIDVADGISRSGSTPVNLSAVSTDKSQVYLLDFGVVNAVTTPQIHAFSPAGASLWTQPMGTVGPVANVGTGSDFAPMVVHLDSTNADVIFYMNDSSNKTLAAVTPGPSSATMKLLTTPNSIWGNLAYGRGAGNAQVIYGVGTSNASNNLWAIDATAAATTGTLTLLWSASTQCLETGGGQGSALFTGSDGTLYHLCTDGTIQAWNPLRTGGLGNGQLLWSYSQVPIFNTTYQRAALVNLGGGAKDTFYVPRVSGGNDGVSILTINGGGSVTRVDTSANPNQQFTNNSGTGVLVDKAGNAIVINNPNTAGPVFVYSPAGTLLSSFLPSGGPALYSPYVSLSDDDVLYMMMGGSAPRLTALQLDAQRKVSVTWQVFGPGNNFWTNAGSAFPTLLPRTGLAPLLLVDFSTVNGAATRDLLGYPMVTGTGLQTPGWPTFGGSNQRRFSLIP